jgi:hypothetical protein
MIVFHGCGFLPRPISVRKHDRPMRHRKSSTASKMFLVIQFDDASNDRFEDIQIRSSEARTQLKAPKRRFNEHAINQDIMTRLKLIDDEFTNLHFAADRSRKSPESHFDDTQHPIEAQPDSLRASLYDEPRQRFVRTEARRATRQDAERAWRISGTAALLRGKRAARRFFCARRRENAGNGKIRTPIVPWVARFCLILFFLDERRRVTHRNRPIKDFLVR